jgi:hypothetical protein
VLQSQIFPVQYFFFHLLSSVHFYQTSISRHDPFLSQSSMSVLSYGMGSCCIIYYWFQSIITWLYRLVATGSGICSYHLFLSTFTSACLQTSKCRNCMQILSWHFVFLLSPRVRHVA